MRDRSTRAFTPLWILLTTLFLVALASPHAFAQSIKSTTPLPTTATPTATRNETTRPPTTQERAPWFDPPESETNAGSGPPPTQSPPTPPSPLPASETSSAPQLTPSEFSDSGDAIVEDESPEEEIEEEFTQTLVIFSLLLGFGAALLFMFLYAHRIAERARMRNAASSVPMLGRPSGIRASRVI